MKSNTVTASTEVLEKIELAMNLAKKHERTYISSVFKEIMTAELVRVSIPRKDAKYLKLIPEHKIVVFIDESLSKLTMTDLDSHYVHGDFPVRMPDNKLRPSVIRHFLVTESAFGNEIVAKVIIKEKVCLLSGEKTIIIDIEETGEKLHEAKNILRLGTTATGSKNEVTIPETEKVIRFDEIKPRTVINKPEAEVKLTVAKKIVYKINDSKNESKLELKKVVKKVEPATESNRFGNRFPLILKKAFS
ncbi:MAG: hypothetical protein ACOYL8_01895 [Patescibacteria group bacterium]